MRCSDAVFDLYGTQDLWHQAHGVMRPEPEYWRLQRRWARWQDAKGS